MENTNGTVRPQAGLWLLCWAGAAEAQTRIGFEALANAVLLALLAGAVIVLLVIRFTLGSKATWISLSGLLIGVGSLVIYGGVKKVKRERAYEKIERSFAEGCAKTSRSIERAARGDERVFIRLQGADVVPEHQRRELLPSKTRIGDGVEVVTELPRDQANAILIDFRYDRELVPGSYSGYEWYRTRYDLTARTLADDRIVAHTSDMEARNGFCLGDLEPFLKQALNRSGVLQGGASGNALVAAGALPDAYVRGEYSASTSGAYLKSATRRDVLLEAKNELRAMGCTVEESTISPSTARCGIPPAGTAQIQLFGLVGLYRLRDSWLFFYRVFKGGNAMASLRAEQRLRDGRLVRVWSANFIPLPTNTSEERLEEFALQGDVMTAAVYWDSKWEVNGSQSWSWYEKRTVLTVPLPGVRR